MTEHSEIESKRDFNSLKILFFSDFVAVKIGLLAFIIISANIGVCLSNSFIHLLIKFLETFFFTFLLEIIRPNLILKLSNWSFSFFKIKLILCFVLLVSGLLVVRKKAEK